MNTRGRLVAAAVAATALAVPATAAAGSATIRATGCPNGALNVWSQGGAIWATAEFANCTSAPNGHWLTVKLYRDGWEINSNSAKFTTPAINIGSSKFAAKAATASTSFLLSNYRACAFFDYTQLACATK